MTATEQLPHGIASCPKCGGKGYLTDNTSTAVPKALICSSCRGARHVVSWWPDAFADRITIDGPLLASDPDCLGWDHPPELIKWRRATLSWSTIMCLSQGPFTTRVYCRLTEIPLIDRDCGCGGVQTTYCHLIDGPPKLIGLPFDLVKRYWQVHLLDQEKRRHEK